MDNLITAEKYLKKSRDYTLYPSQRQVARAIAEDIITRYLRAKKIEYDSKELNYTTPMKSSILNDYPKETIMKKVSGLLP